jgi:excisionase family DNA binding protein
MSATSSDEKLTTGEAAELLNVSRPHLVQLLEEGEIPFKKVGGHRLVYREDVLEYKAHQREEAEEATQNLTDQAQELGLGY